ncbi:nitrate reductase [Tessaracoccus lapidicaptus]|uniref:Nitrate reductase n=1 Tax=Tessaracoccus lapidicaptus TaxID=1427523 RepID=A0A1C0APU5_9ACTN|nr:MULTISPECIES: solute carrier family 23 protein [Tessaracoccus]AQX15344.1 nitrate reductase [Tessaracoccus sp. T2.5-30]OCL36333.1 nitrate reductase [Tessaracoccus lapidicaptus]VEP39631.1 Putative pyrimidine permease RutG [Tessaracoccus lapidicaptus]
MWKLHNNGILEPDAVVKPTERLTWGRTIGLGAQHVVAMFGATFVFPLLMGLNPQLAVMMSGIATLVFLVAVKHRVPSYLGSSASFVGVATAIYGAGGDPADLTGALFVVGLTLFMVGLIIHFAGAKVIHRALPPVVTGAVVMLIGFNLAPVVASVYWPVDPWLAFVVMLIVIALSIGLRGFMGRIAIFLSLVIGYILSWVFDLAFGPMQKVAEDGTVTEQLRVDWASVASADWFGLPPVSDLATWSYGATDNVVGFHLPSFSFAAIIVALPVVIALIAENTGHVKAVAEMTGEDLDPIMGRAIAADGAGSMLATFVGAGPTTTYAENIGVMAATRVYSTAAYVVAALVAILFGFSPKFGAVISATPGAVLGGITVVLYGMIGLLGAKIWKENRVDFGNPLNLIPAAAGIIIGVGDVQLPFGDGFSLGGIALGTIVTIGVYHLARLIAPREMREAADGASLIYDAPGIYVDEDDDPVR